MESSKAIKYITYLSIDPLFQVMDEPQNALKTFPRFCPELAIVFKWNTLTFVKFHHNNCKITEHHLKSFRDHHISRGFLRNRFSFSNTCESVHDEKRRKISTWLLCPLCW